MHPERTGFQVTIDDFVLDTEVIPGAVPPGADAAAAARDQFYRAIAAGFTGSCRPPQKIHVFAVGATQCLCAIKKESQ